MDDNVIFKCLQEIADEYFDGHFTIMKFTTNWKISFFTPNDRDDINMKMFTGKTFYEAFKNLIGIESGGNPTKDLRNALTLDEEIDVEIANSDYLHRDIRK